jgi:hypothetical protein
VGNNVWANTRAKVKIGQLNFALRFFFLFFRRCVPRFLSKMNNSKVIFLFYVSRVFILF